MLMKYRSALFTLALAGLVATSCQKSKSKSNPPKSDDVSETAPAPQKQNPTISITNASNFAGAISESSVTVDFASTNVDPNQETILCKVGQTAELNSITNTRIFMIPGVSLQKLIFAD